MGFSPKDCLYELVHRAKAAASHCRHFARLASSRKFKAISLSGMLPGTDMPIKVLYLGHAENIAPIREYFFDGIAKTEELGAIHAFSQRRARARYFTADMDAVVMARLPWEARAAQGIYMTSTLHSVLPLPSAMDDLLAALPETERRKLRQALKAGFEVETAGAESDYREFHERMFGPLMRFRHGPKAYVTPFEQLYKLSERASLIFIRNAGKRVGGILVRWPRINGTHALPHFDKIGIVDEVSQDSTQYNRVNVALYYQMFNATMQRGYPRISLGVIQPLLNNGLLRFKARWGSNLFAGSHEFDFYRHNIAFCSKKLHEIQCQRHLVHLGERGLVATVGIKDSEAGTPALEAKLNGARFSNLTRIDLAYPDGHVETRELRPDSAPPEVPKSSAEIR